MDSLVQRALEWAITFVVVALLLHWGWDILRPFIPIVFLIGIVMVVLHIAISRYRRF